MCLEDLITAKLAEKSNFKSMFLLSAGATSEATGGGGLTNMLSKINTSSQSSSSEEIDPTSLNYRAGYAAGSTASSTASSSTGGSSTQSSDQATTVADTSTSTASNRQGGSQVPQMPDPSTMLK